MHKDRLPDVDAFLEELTTLSLKYKIKLWACNCCDGINLLELKKENEPQKYKYQQIKDENSVHTYELTWGNDQC